MTSERQFDALLRSWLEESAPSGQPQGLLESVLSATAHTRPRPAWLVRLRGEPMPETGRPGLNRFAPFGLAATAILITILLGIALFVRPSPPDVGPNATFSPSPPASPSAGPSVAVVQPRAPAWIPTGGMSQARYLQTATLLPDGKVLVAGGGIITSSGSGSTVSAELYDPSSGSWSATGNMRGARAAQTATLLPDGTVLVAGNRPGGGGAVATAELYDPVSGSWTATANMLVPGIGHTATLLPDGKVLVAGGGIITSSGYGSTASAQLYDPSSGSWTATGNMVAIRSGGFTATLLPDGRVLVAGAHGVLGDGESSAELYDPSSGSWTATGNMVAIRGGVFTATLLPDGKVLVAGGGIITSSGSGSTASAELYDPSSGSWTATGNMVAIREGGFTATLLPDGKVLVVGGHNGKGTLASAELYDPGSGMWTAIGNMDAARYGYTATLLPDGKVLVAGGAGFIGESFGSLASAELYDPGSGN